jgi:hypothetical protein
MNRTKASQSTYECEQPIAESLAKCSVVAPSLMCFFYIDSMIHRIQPVYYTCVAWQDWVYIKIFIKTHQNMSGVTTNTIFNYVQHGNISQTQKYWWEHTRICQAWQRIQYLTTCNTVRLVRNKNIFERVILWFEIA